MIWPLLVLAGPLIFLIHASLYGVEASWQIWHIPTMLPEFADIRTITGGAVSVEMGYDPMLENPGDPWGRTINYPRIWQLLYRVGLGPEHAWMMGLTMVSCYIAALCLLQPGGGPLAMCLLFAAAYSPAAVFGIERGNNDLLVFLLVVLAVRTIDWRSTLSVLLLFLAVVLKLFPVFAAPLLLKLPQRAAVKCLTGLAVAALVYGAITWNDLALIAAGTPQQPLLSYGISGIWLNVPPELEFVTKSASYLLALGWLFRVARVTSHNYQAITENFSICAFRAGAGIYATTFLLGANWDYRLIFLLLTIPALAAWSVTAQAQLRRWSRCTLVAIFLSLWHIVLLAIGPYIAGGFQALFFLDEAANWTIFIGVTFLLATTLPDWIARTIRSIGGRDQNLQPQ